MSDKPRILLLTNRVPWPMYDGGAVAMQAMLKAYLHTGWEVGLLTMNTTRHGVDKTVVDAKFSHLDFLQVVPIDNRLKPGRVLGNFIFSQLPEHVQRFSSKLYEDELVDALKVFKPQVIQFESLFLASYIPTIKKHSNAKLVLRMHNVEYEIWKRLGDCTTGWKGQYFKHLAGRMDNWETKAWQQFDLLLPITNADEELVKAAGCTVLTHLVPVGIEISENPVSPPTSFTRGFHIGAMDWQPNREAISWFLKDVWPLVQKAAPAFSFTFAGRHLKASFCLPLPAGITNSGTVESASAFMQQHDVLIVPLLAGSGIRVKILEAMAMGKLVISTSIGMQGIAAEEGLHFLKADTAVEFSNQIKWAVQNEKAATIISESGQHFVRAHFDAEKINKVLSAKVLS